MKKIPASDLALSVLLGSHFKLVLGFVTGIIGLGKTILPSPGWIKMTSLMLGIIWIWGGNLGGASLAITLLSNLESVIDFGKCLSDD